MKRGNDGYYYTSIDANGVGVGNRLTTEQINAYAGAQNAQVNQSLQGYNQWSLGLGALNSGLNAYSNLSNILNHTQQTIANNQVVSMRNNTRLALGQFKNNLNSTNQLKQNRAIGSMALSGQRFDGSINTLNKDINNTQSQVNSWDPNAKHTKNEIINHQDSVNSLSRYNTLKGRMTNGDLKQESMSDYSNIQAINPDDYKNVKSW